MRPHGLRGQVVVEMYSNRPERVEVGARVRWSGGELAVEQASRVAPSGGTERWILGFRGVGDRDAAECLRDETLYAEPLDDPAAFWIHDLIGAEVVDGNGEPVGRVVAVEANPASDLLVLEDGRLIPLRFITAREGGRLTVEGPPGLLDKQQD